jgi:hypothetical protein
MFNLTLAHSLSIKIAAAYWVYKSMYLYSVLFQGSR